MFEPNPMSIPDWFHRANSLLNEAAKRADPYNDFGGVLGIQDELGEISERFEEDLKECARRCRRLINRIEKWEKGERSPTMLRAVTPEPPSCPS